MGLIQLILPKERETAKTIEIDEKQVVHYEN